MTQRACAQCHALFTAEKPSRKYCSVSCSVLSRVGRTRGPYKGHEPEPRQCAVCDRSFIVGGRGRPSRRTTCCSLQCARHGRYRQGKQAQTLPAVQAAYLAGLVDGEGSIMLVGRTQERSAVHVRLSIANTHLPCLQWVSEATGLGRIYQQREASATHRQSFSWRLHGDGADSVIRQLRPYLIIKAPQADLAIEAVQRLRTPKDKADLSWQAEYQDRMRVMNKRGGS